MVLSGTQGSGVTGLFHPPCGPTSTPGSRGWRMCRPTCWGPSGSCSPARLVQEAGVSQAAITCRSKPPGSQEMPTARIPTNAPPSQNRPGCSGAHPRLRRRGRGQRRRGCRRWQGCCCCGCGCRGCCCRRRCGCRHRRCLLVGKRRKRRAAQAGGCRQARVDELTAPGDQLQRGGRPGHRWLVRRSLLAGGLAGPRGAPHRQPHGCHVG